MLTVPDMAHHVSGMTQLIELTLSDDNPYGMPLDFRCLAALTRLRVLRLLRGGVSSEALATLAVSLPSSRSSGRRAYAFSFRSRFCARSAGLRTMRIDDVHACACASESNVAIQPVTSLMRLWNLALARYRHMQNTHKNTAPSPTAQSCY